MENLKLKEKNQKMPVRPIRISFQTFSHICIPWWTFVEHSVDEGSFFCAWALGIGARTRKIPQLRSPESSSLQLFLENFFAFII